VFTLRLQPGNPDRMIAATYGRGVYQYCFAAACVKSVPNQTFPNTVISTLPNTAGGAQPTWALLPPAAMVMGAGLMLRRRRRRNSTI
jgi:LPXTG-motif cell wall-anchored protein